jgi:cohesin loading factor subunit SCC2
MQSIVTTPRNTAGQLTLNSPISKSPTRKRFAYVEVPPLPMSYRTPSKSQDRSGSLSVSTKRFGKMKVDDTPDDLGGYGSEEDDSYSPVRGSVKSSTRRTGDRDDRGKSVIIQYQPCSHLVNSTAREINSSTRRYLRSRRCFTS